MLFRKMRFAITLLTLPLSFCQSSFAQETNIPAKPTALRFVYAAGFMSCRIGTEEPMNQWNALVSEFEDNNKERVVDSGTYDICFDAGILEHPLDSIEHVYSRYLGSNETATSLPEVAAVAVPDQIVTALDTDARALEGQGFEMPLRVYVAGHSHGGWLAMQIVAKLAGNPRVQVVNLMTVDAISYSLCASGSFWRNIARNTPPIWSNNIPDDCHRAPRDLVALEPTIAATTEGRWTNFYQTSMPYVKSGPIAGASWNIDLPWVNTIDYWMGHRALWRDARVWVGFWGIVAHDLGEL